MMGKGRLSIGTKLYLCVLSLFVLFAAAFIVFQQHREKQYKVGMLDMRLQYINGRADEAMTSSGDSIAGLEEYLREHPDSALRVTVIGIDGKVLFDNMYPDYSSLGDHSGRPEVRQAILHGTGSSVERNSATLGGDYFYSATYYPRHAWIVRSALPYGIKLSESLKTDQHYIWFSLAILLVLTLVLFRFTGRLGRNIKKLNDFAAFVDGGGLTSSKGSIGSQLSDFSDDELGDTAERIVKLYLKLQTTQKEQDVLKRQLTQNVAHELKTPVASIQGYLETIISHPEIDSGTRDQFLDRCYAQSQRLSSLLADISTLNRLDDGAGMMTFEDVDLAEIIRSVQQESQLALQQKGMTMRCDIPDHIIIHGNRSLLYSIFRNLTDNSIAYAGLGKDITLKCTLPRDEGMPVQFTFSDNGVGVAPEHLPRLFERFYRVDKGRSRKMGGTGLGLAIVKNAVRVHGGTISVCNNPDGGLRFDFTLK